MIEGPYYIKLEYNVSYFKEHLGVLSENVTQSSVDMYDGVPGHTQIGVW